MHICLCGDKPNTNADSQIITTTPITTKNYPPITPVPLSSSLMSKTHELHKHYATNKLHTAFMSLSQATKFRTQALLMPSYDQIPITTKNYPPIAPVPLSSSLMSKTHELQQQALLMPRAMTKSPIRPPSQASSELIVSVNVAKNPITKGEPEVFRIAIHDTNSNNNIGNARLSGIVLDPTRNSIQNKFNGTSNSNGTYSYSWTIPRTVKSQTYQVKVNASTVDPVLYSLKPGVAVFSVNSISSGSTYFASSSCGQ